MAKPRLSDHHTAADHLNYQTWILSVLIHCEGCKKKVLKILQKIDGVYKTVIDSEQNKVIVTGSVDGDTLVQKLRKHGKQAEISPESFGSTAAVVNASGKSKKKKKQSNKLSKDEYTATGDDEEIGGEEKAVEHSGLPLGVENDGRINQVQALPTGIGGGGGKKKKKKGKGDNNTTPQPNGVIDGTTTENAAADTGSVSIPATTTAVDPLNLGPPSHPLVYTAPFAQPPYQSYYPAPVYGMSYSTSFPSADSSFHAPPVYGYAQSYPPAYYAPPPPSKPISAFDDDHDDDDRRGCCIM